MTNPWQEYAQSVKSDYISNNNISKGSFNVVSEPITLNSDPIYPPSISQNNERDLLVFEDNDQHGGSTRSSISIHSLGQFSSSTSLHSQTEIAQSGSDKSKWNLLRPCKEKSEITRSASDSIYSTLNRNPSESIYVTKGTLDSIYAPKGTSDNINAMPKRNPSEGILASPRRYQSESIHASSDYANRRTSQKPAMIRTESIYLSRSSQGSNLASSRENQPPVYRSTRTGSYSSHPSVTEPQWQSPVSIECAQFDKPPAEQTSQFEHVQWEQTPQWEQVQLEKKPQWEQQMQLGQKPQWEKQMQWDQKSQSEQVQWDQNSSQWGGNQVPWINNESNEKQYIDTQLVVQPIVQQLVGQPVFKQTTLVAENLPFVQQSWETKDASGTTENPAVETQQWNSQPDWLLDSILDDSIVKYSHEEMMNINEKIKHISHEKGLAASMAICRMIVMERSTAPMDRQERYDNGRGRMNSNHKTYNNNNYNQRAYDNHSKPNTCSSFEYKQSSRYDPVRDPKNKSEDNEYIGFDNNVPATSESPSIVCLKCKGHAVV